MTDRESSPSEITALHSDVDSNGIPILNDVVEEAGEIEYTPASSSTSHPTPSQTIELNKIKETLRQELSDELNELIQSVLLETAIQITSQVENVIERKLSDALQKQLGEQLKTALEERFKNNRL